MKKFQKTTIGIVIPSYMPGGTIQHVMKTIYLGLKKYFKNSEFFIVIVDSSDNITQKSILNTAELLGKNVILHFSKKRITKGKAIFTGLNILKNKKPNAILFIDADIKSIEPYWVYEFLTPILSKKIDFIGPLYTRDKYDSLITNHVVYPFVKMMLKANLRQPIGGDFAISGKLMNFYLKKKCFPPEVNKFGIDIWLSTNAILQKFKIGQVYLGIKEHRKTIKDPNYPEKSLGTMFREVIKTLFDVLIFYKKNWPNLKMVDVVTYGKPKKSIPKPVIADSYKLWKTFIRLYPVYQSQIHKVLKEHITGEIETMLKIDQENTKFTAQLWANILFSYLLKYEKIKNEDGKRKVIESLLPMYFARIACFVSKSKNLDVKMTEENIQSSLETFDEAKTNFLKKFIA